MTDDIRDSSQSEPEIERLKFRLFRHLVDMLSVGDSEDRDRVHDFVHREFRGTIDDALQNAGLSNQVLDKILSNTERSISSTNEASRTLNHRITNIENIILREVLNSSGNDIESSTEEGKNAGADDLEQSGHTDSRSPEKQHSREERSWFGKTLYFLDRNIYSLICGLVIIGAIGFLIWIYWGIVFGDYRSKYERYYGETSTETTAIPTDKDRRSSHTGNPEVGNETPGKPRTDNENSGNLDKKNGSSRSEEISTKSVRNSGPPTTADLFETCSSGLSSYSTGCKKRLVEEFNIIVTEALGTSADSPSVLDEICSVVTRGSDEANGDFLRKECTQRIDTFGATFLRRDPVVFVQIVLLVMSDYKANDESCWNINFERSSVDGRLGPATNAALRKAVECLRKERVGISEEEKQRLTKSYELVDTMLKKTESEVNRNKGNSAANLLRLSPTTDILLDELTLAAAYRSLRTIQPLPGGGVP